MFSVFKICCWYNPEEDDQNTVENISIRYSNCGKQTMIYKDKINTTYQDIITSFVLNTVLHHVGMLFIIETNEQIKYDMDKHNSDWMTGGPWYNTYISKKINENIFETFIRNARTEIYNTMCSIDAPKKINPSEHDDESSGGGYPIPSNSTTEASDSLIATIYFIGCWLKSLKHNLIERCHMYTFALKNKICY